MANSIPTTVLRAAGNFEHRCIIRHELGYYGNLTVGALYQVEARPPRTSYEDAFVTALKYCITKHAFLSASIQDPGSETPIFVRPDYLELDRHLHILEPAQSLSSAETSLREFKDFLINLCDSPAAYQEGIPPWKLIILPVSTTDSSFWACLCYSHSHGDGKSGMAFHRTFLQALQQQQRSDSTSATTNTISTTATITTSGLPPLPPSLESAAKLTITWQYLLSPLLGTYLPKFISSTLGISTSHAGSDANAWKAKPFSYNTTTHTTGLEFTTLDAATLTSLLQVCRTNGVKLTGILHQAIVHALSTQLTSRGKADATTTFVATTPLDLRNLVPEHDRDNTFINCVSGANETFLSHPSPQNKINDDNNDNKNNNNNTIHIPSTTWTRAKQTSAYLASRASTLENQPITLLSYLSNYKTYMQSQLGNSRGDTYEISNLGNFAPLPSTEMSNANTNPSWTITNMVFVQPANAVGPGLNFNVVSTARAGLVMTVTWQRGVIVLGGKDEDEEEVGFARGVCEGVEAFLVRASGG